MASLKDQDKKSVIGEPQKDGYPGL